MADVDDLYTLTSMVNLGSNYLACQDENDDKKQIETMTGILTTITTELMPAEITEPPEQYDSMGGMSAMEQG
jgi:hypothetical protein